MVQNNSPDENSGKRDDSGKFHEDSVEAAKRVLSELHAPGSFNLEAVTKGKVTVVRATDNPQYLAERKQVAEDLGSTEEILKLAEKNPAQGSTHEVTIGGFQQQIVVDSIEPLLNLVQLGLETVGKAYTLVEEEKQKIQSFQKRLDTLRESD